jgi:hypothetical protein
MANSKISALTSATTPLAGTEVLPIVQSSATVKVAVNDMLSVTSWTSPAVDSNGNMFLRATDAFATGVGTQIGLGGKYNTTSYYPFGAISGRKENATGNNVAGYLSLLTTTSGGTLTERFRVNSSGNLVPSVAAKGVDFTANTPAAGMTSQLLNWYEEGTWTPTQGAGLVVVGTFSSSGRYTRIGRQVTVSARLAGSTSIACTAGGVFTTGLPYAPNSVAAGAATSSNLAGTILYVDTTIYSVSAMAAAGSLSMTATYSV